MLRGAVLRTLGNIFPIVLLDNFFYCIINLLDQYEFHHYNVRKSHIMKAVA